MDNADSKSHYKDLCCYERKSALDYMVSSKGRVAKVVSFFRSSDWPCAAIAHNIEGSKSNVAMNVWLPQASHPCGHFSGTSSWIFLRPEGWKGHVFTICIRTEIEIKQAFPLLVHMKCLSSLNLLLHWLEPICSVFKFLRKKQLTKVTLRKA